MKKEGQWTIEKNTIDSVSDFALGFFTFPFAYFVIIMSVEMIKNPLPIGDGRAIIYVALLTGFVYFLKGTIVIHIGLKKENIMFMLFGFVTLILLFNYL